MQKYSLFFIFNQNIQLILMLKDNYFIGKTLCLIRTNSDNFNIN